MYLILFALLSIAGSWAAWRRNPLYNTRSSLRSVLFVLLAIAAIVALVVAAVRLASGKSPAILFTTIGAFILFGTLSLIFIIQTLSTPKPAAIPLNTPLVHFHRQKTRKWVVRFAIFVAAVAIGGWIIPGTVKIIFLCLGGMTIFLGLVMLPTQYVVARNNDRALTSLQFNPWVHWQYSPAQWAAWSDIQAQRLKSTPPAFIWKRDWRKPTWTMAAIAAGVYLFSPGSRLYQTLYILAITALLFLIAILGTRSAATAPQRLRAKLLAIPPEAWLGPDGIFCDGTLTSWLDVSNFLTAATLDDRPPRSLLFSFERNVPGGTGRQIIQVDQAVLIPEDPAATSDIAHLQKELTTCYPKARVHLC